MSASPRQLRSPPLCDHLRPTRRACLRPKRRGCARATLDSGRASLLYPPTTPRASLVVRAS
ncbi:hypothetical protein T492DRAFT_953270 [Pavlovales sp. CCMP2436]|nr:hypothetical protein T492DRAFT_953270 [Pavlovales sp. CCMP2436]